MPTPDVGESEGKRYDYERKVGRSPPDCAGEQPEVAGIQGKGESGMTLTDAEAIKALKKVRCYDLEERLSEYPEEERDGRTDWDMIADEAGWLLDSFHDDSCLNYVELEEARALIRETKNGTVFKGLLTTAQLRSCELKVQGARDLINMVNRLARFVQKLKGMGLY